MIHQFALIFVLSLGIIRCQDEYSALKRLRSDLLANYDKHSRPVKHPSTTINVKFQLWLYRILGLSIERQTLSADGSIFLSWTDELMKWDPEKYQGINKVKFDPDEVWTPDVYLANMAPGWTKADRYAHQQVTIEYNGNVRYVTATKLIVGCYLDLSEYPFDDQKCYMHFHSENYNANQVNLIARRKNGPIHTTPYYSNPEWNVVNISGSIYTDYDEVYNVSVAILTFKLQRRADIHQYYIFLPYLTASLFGLVVFLLPVGSKSRLVSGGLALFILINLLVFFAFELGFHSLGVPFAVRCISMNILLVSLSLIVTSLVYHILMHLMKTCPPLPSLLAHHLNTPLLGYLLCINGDIDIPDPDEESNGDSLRTTSPAVIREWIRLIRLIDRILFIIYIVFLIFYHS